MLENVVDKVTGRRSSLARHTCIAWSLGGGLASLAIPVCLKMLALPVLPRLKGGALENFVPTVFAVHCFCLLWRLHGCHGNRCIRIFSGVHGCPWISWWTVRPSLPFLGLILGIRFHGFSMGWIRFLFSPIPRSLGGGHWRCHTCLFGLARQA